MDGGVHQVRPVHGRPDVENRICAAAIGGAR
jgi:hypothetical protein